MARKADPISQSRVDFIGNVLSTSGTVRAPNEKFAIAEAAKLFDVTPVGRVKIVVTKLDPNRTTTMIRKQETLPSAMVKRSVHIAGHDTSVTLEDAFWTAVREIAAIQNIGRSELVSRIAKDRQNKNLWGSKM